MFIKSRNIQLYINTLRIFYRILTIYYSNLFNKALDLLIIIEIIYI